MEHFDLIVCLLSGTCNCIQYTAGTDTLQTNRFDLYDVHEIQTSAEIPCNVHQTQTCTHMIPDSDLYTQDPKTQAELSSEHHNHNALPRSHGVYDHIASISYVR